MEDPNYGQPYGTYEPEGQEYRRMMAREAREENRLNFYGASGEYPKRNRNNYTNYKKQNTMSYGRNQGGRSARISSDRFGNAYQLKTAYEVVNKKTGEVIDNHYKCSVELGGKLYRIEVSPRVKETKTGANAMWCKVTKINAQQRQTSM